MKGRKPNLSADPLALQKTPPAPKHLSDGARHEWRRVLPQLVAAGVVRSSDLALLSSYCALVAVAAEYEAAHAASGTMDPKALRAMISATEAARRIASEFGMTAVSRSRVGMVAAEAGEGASPLDL